MTVIVGPSEEMTRLGECRDMFVKPLEDLGRSDLRVSELLGVHSVPPPPAPQEIPEEIKSRRSIDAHLRSHTAEELAEAVSGYFIN